MKRAHVLIGAGVAALALGGCNRGADGGSNLPLTGSSYCVPFKTTAVASAPGAALTDPAAAFDDCIHRWGYALAPARDPADVVAQATVDACGPILSAWSQQLAGQGQAQGPGAQGGSGAQGQPNPAAQRLRMAESRALFYVVQARAGGCRPPPAKTLLSTSPTAG